MEVYWTWGCEDYLPDFSTFSGFICEWKVCQELGRQYKDSDCICYSSHHKIFHISRASLMLQCIGIHHNFFIHPRWKFHTSYLWGVTAKVRYGNVRGWKSLFIILTRLWTGWQRNQGLIPSRGRNVSLSCGVLTTPASYYLGTRCSDLDQFLSYITYYPIWYNNIIDKKK